MASAFGTAGKKALLDAVVAHTWKAALYTSAATLDATTPAYTATNEVSGGGYTAGGNTLSGAVTASASRAAWLDFNAASCASATVTARYLTLYDATRSN